MIFPNSNFKNLNHKFQSSSVLVFKILFKNSNPKFQSTSALILNSSILNFKYEILNFKSNFQTLKFKRPNFRILNSQFHEKCVKKTLYLVQEGISSNKRVWVWSPGVQAYFHFAFSNLSYLEPTLQSFLKRPWGHEITYSLLLPLLKHVLWDFGWYLIIIMPLFWRCFTSVWIRFSCNSKWLRVTLVTDKCTNVDWFLRIMELDAMLSLIPCPLQSFAVYWLVMTNSYLGGESCCDALRFHIYIFPIFIYLKINKWNLIKWRKT